MHEAPTIDELAELFPGGGLHWEPLRPVLGGREVEAPDFERAWRSLGPDLQARYLASLLAVLVGGFAAPVRVAVAVALGPDWSLDPPGPDADLEARLSERQRGCVARALASVTDLDEPAEKRRNGWYRAVQAIRWCWTDDVAVTARVRAFYAAALGWERPGRPELAGPCADLDRCFPALPIRPTSFRPAETVGNGDQALEHGWELACDRWASIDPDFVELHRMAPAFCDAEHAPALLPAYLVAALHGRTGALDHLDVPAGHHSFSPEQREAVLTVLSAIGTAAVGDDERVLRLRGGVADLHERWAKGPDG